MQKVEKKKADLSGEGSYAVSKRMGVARRRHQLPDVGGAKHLQTRKEQITYYKWIKGENARET